MRCNLCILFRLRSTKNYRDIPYCKQKKVTVCFYSTPKSTNTDSQLDKSLKAQDCESRNNMKLETTARTSIISLVRERFIIYEERYRV